MDSHSPTPLVISWLIDIVPLNTLDSYRSDVWSALDLNLEVFRFFSANGRSLLLFAQVSRKWKSFAIKYTQVLPKASEFLPGSIALVPFWTSLQACPSVLFIYYYFFFPAYSPGTEDDCSAQHEITASPFPVDRSQGRLYQIFKLSNRNAME